jgi:hypothetical protein
LIDTYQKGHETCHWLEPTMKIQMLFTPLLAILIFLNGCSSPKFTKYSGSEIFQGTGGGTMRTIDGIQFWEHGEPDRKYKILGVIDHSHKHGHLPSFGSTDSTIAKVARERGGDAVMLVTKDDEPASEEGVFGSWSHRQSVTLVLIKFVE